VSSTNLSPGQIGSEDRWAGWRLALTGKNPEFSRIHGEVLSPPPKRLPPVKRIYWDWLIRFFASGNFLQELRRKETLRRAISPVKFRHAANGA
jgi:hypothetical protein